MKNLTSFQDFIFETDIKETLLILESADAVKSMQSLSKDLTLFDKYDTVIKNVKILLAQNANKIEAKKFSNLKATVLQQLKSFMQELGKMVKIHSSIKELSDVYKSLKGILTRVNAHSYTNTEKGGK